MEQRDLHPGTTQDGSSHLDSITPMSTTCARNANCRHIRCIATNLICKNYSSWLVRKPYLVLIFNIFDALRHSFMPESSMHAASPASCRVGAAILTGSLSCTDWETTQSMASAPQRRVSLYLKHWVQTTR